MGQHSCGAVSDPRPRGPGARHHGLDVETPWRAASGYALRGDAWGRGLASEAAVAMTRLADDLGVIRLHALCHRDNTASARVLAKAGFLREGVFRRYPAGSAGRGCSRGICSGRTVRRGGQGFLASAAAPSGVGVVGQPASLLANIDVVWSVSTTPFLLSAWARRKNAASSESPSLPNHHA